MSNRQKAIKYLANKAATDPKLQRQLGIKEKTRKHIKGLNDLYLQNKQPAVNLATAQLTAASAPQQ